MCVCVCVRVCVVVVVCMLSHVQLFATPWTITFQTPLSMGFPKQEQEYWSWPPFSPPGDLPDPGIEPGSPALQADFLPPVKPCMCVCVYIYIYVCVCVCVCVCICHILLQGNFPTQGSNPGLPHCRQTLYCLSHKGSPMYIYKPT